MKKEVLLDLKRKLLRIEQERTGYPSIDLPQSSNSTFFEKHPVIPSVDFITILKLLSRKTRENQAIDCNNLRATYQQLLDDSHKIALAYRELGIKKGDIVTISLKSNYQALCSFLALNEIGAVTTFIDEYAKNDEILNYLNLYESPLFINSDTSKEQNEIIKKKSKVDHIITLNNNLANSLDISNDYKKNSDEFIDFHTLGSIASFQKDRIHLPNKGSDDALILYTSGSTGQPKSVVLTNKNILAAQMYAGNTSHTENIKATKTMTCVPLRYPYGMVTSLLTSLLWGKEAIMTPDWDSKTVPYYYGKNPHVIFGSPAVLEVTERFLPKDFDLSQVSHFISGGDFLTVERANRGYDFFKKHNNETVEIGNGCGNAETVSIGSTPVGVPLKQSTAGKILVGSTPLIIDSNIPDDKPIENPELLEEKRYNEIGELCLAGDHVFKEYFGEEDKTRNVKFIRNGKEFFRTGTLGFIDEEGYFTPTDRKSRFYIRSTGHKVYLDNVQNIISSSDSRIVSCATVKVPDADELFVNKAFIVLESGVTPSEDLKAEIMKKIEQPVMCSGKKLQLKDYELPVDIEFIDELPRLEGSEKIDYSILENMELVIHNEEITKQDLEFSNDRGYVRALKK